MLSNNLVSQFNAVFTFPAVFLHYEKLLKNQNATMDDFANLLLTDPITSSSILRLVNSAMYSKNRTISTLTMAITILGIKTITELLYRTVFEKLAASVISERASDMKLFWRKSLTKAFVAKNIARHLKMNDIEEIFISALLSQIGCLPIISFSHENYYMTHESTDTYPWIRQNNITGFSTNELSYELLDSWGVPPRLTIPIKHAHDDKIELNRHANILHAAWLAILSYIYPEMYKQEELLKLPFFTKLKLCPEELNVLINSGIESAEKSLPTFITPP